MRVRGLVLKWHWGLRIETGWKRSENRDGDIRDDHDFTAIFERHPAAPEAGLVLMALVKIGYCLLIADVKAFWLAGDLDHKHSRLLLFTVCIPVHGASRIILQQDENYHRAPWSVEGITKRSIETFVSSSGVVTER